MTATTGRKFAVGGAEDQSHEVDRQQHVDADCRRVADHAAEVGAMVVVAPQPT